MEHWRHYVTWASLLIIKAILMTGCTVPERVSTAGKDWAQAIHSLNSAIETVENDPALSQINQDLIDARNDLHAGFKALLDRHPDQVDAIFQQAIDVGAADESCASRCKHECGGLDVASCFLNCSNSNCHPSCCGCKDGGPACDGCGASCNSITLSQCKSDDPTVGGTQYWPECADVKKLITACGLAAARNGIFFAYSGR